MAVNWKPDTYNQVIPYFVVNDASKLIEFITNVLGAKKAYEINGPDGSIAHAELRLGESVLMLGQAGPQNAAAQNVLYVYVPDIDATFKKALAQGATSVREPEDMFYGDRSGCIKDPFGNQWWLATHVEDPTPEQMKERSEQWSSQLKNKQAGG